MHLSSQLHISDINIKWKGIYSPFGHGIAFLYIDYWNKLVNGEYDKLDKTIIEYLIENNILVEDGFEKKWILANYRVPKINISSMFLVITYNCNFACKYCVVEKNSKKSFINQKNMTINVADNAIDLFKKILQQGDARDARITYYGGEPTLNKKIISHTVPRINEVDKYNNAIDIVMITNGFLFDEKLVALFQKYNVGVCVSIDGKEKHQNITRITKSHKKMTFDRVITNYKKYKSANLSMGISCALGTHNAFDLPEIALFFAEELQPNFVEFQIPYQVSGGNNPLWVSTREITENIMEAYKILNSYGIIEGLVYRRMRDILSKKIHYTDCGAPGSQLVVAPNGMVGPCHSLVGSGHYFSGNVNEINCNPNHFIEFSEWAARYSLNMPLCHDCPYITICGGGCPYNSYISNGTIWGKDPQTCNHLPKMIDWILKEIWSNSKIAA